MSVVTSMTRSQSLVEQKKLQWAREREELVNFYGLWGSQYAAQLSLSKNQFFSSTDLHQRDLRSELCPPEVISDSKQEHSSVPKKRSPSLPPISSKAVGRKDVNSAEGPEGNAEDKGEETSGYNSDTAGNEANQESTDLNRLPRSSSLRRRSSAKSVHEEQREVGARSSWGERMKTSQNCSVDVKFPQLSDGSEVPYWLENKLDQMSCDSLRGRADGMPAKHVEFRGSTDTIYSQDGSTRSFIRGQNVPLTTEELIERDRRRQKALEHQNAIKEQLTEKEQKKREEKERKLREEMEEEIRIRKQQEMERKRMEAEEFKRRFKQEQEMRKAEVMQEALRQAERLAKEAKTRLRIKPFHCQTPSAATPAPAPGPTKARKTKQRRSHPQPPPRVLEPDPLPRLEPDLDLETDHRWQDRIRRDSERVGEYESGAESAESLGSTSASLSITVKTSRDSQVSVSLSPSRALGPAPTPTPPPGERLRQMVDRATQTDAEREPCHRQCRLPLRYRAQARQRIQPLNERPKWGVNRPGVRYIKQSEKDPHYQKWRRLRRISSETNKSSSTSPTRRIYGCESNAEQITASEKNTGVTRETYDRNQDSSEEGSTYYSRPRIIERDDYGGSATSMRGEHQQKNKTNSCSEPCLTSEFHTGSREKNDSIYSRITSSIHREGKGKIRRAPSLYRSHSPMSSDESIQSNE